MFIYQTFNNICPIFFVINQEGPNQGAAVSNEKSLFTHRFNRWRWPQKDCDF